MSVEWYYGKEGRQFGPVAEQQLAHLAATGHLKASDLVWHDGMANWAPAASVPGPLAEQFAALEQEQRTTAEESSQIVTNLTGVEHLDRPLPPLAALDIHPLLALLLALLTGGLFALWYFWHVATVFSQMMPRRTVDARDRPLGKLRHPVAVLVLSYLTLAYLYYWVYAVLRECQAYLGRRDLSPRIDVTLAVLCPLYLPYLLAIKLPAQLRKVQQKARVPESGSLAAAPWFLNPCLWIGLPVLAMSHQDSLNEVWLTAP